MIVLGFPVLLWTVTCFSFMPRACGTLHCVEEYTTLKVWLVHLSWETFMHEFIAIKIVSCFPSFEANFCLRNNQDGYRSKSVTAMGDLIICKLSLLYSLSRVVHRVVQRKQFTFLFRVQNLCENAVSCQRQSAASGDGSVSRCSRKNCNG